MLHFDDFVSAWPDYGLPDRRRLRACCGGVRHIHMVLRVAHQIAGSLPRRKPAETEHSLAVRSHDVQIKVDQSTVRGWSSVGNPMGIMAGRARSHLHVVAVVGKAGVREQTLLRVAFVAEGVARAGVPNVWRLPGSGGCGLNDVVALQDVDIIGGMRPRRLGKPSAKLTPFAIIVTIRTINQ